MYTHTRRERERERERTHTHTHLVNPQFTDDDIMNGRDDFVPGEVVPTAMEHDVCIADWITHQVLAPELRGYCIFLPHCEVLVFYVHGKHGGMMRHLGRGGGRGGRESGKEREESGEEIQ